MLQCTLYSDYNFYVELISMCFKYCIFIRTVFISYFTLFSWLKRLYLHSKKMVHSRPRSCYHSHLACQQYPNRKIFKPGCKPQPRASMVGFAKPFMPHTHSRSQMRPHPFSTQLKGHWLCI